jgi:chitinase
MTILTYDYHYPTQKYTGICAPLYASPSPKNPEDKWLNVDASVRFWIEKGAPPSKINIAIPAFGWTFQLKNNHLHTPGAECTAPGEGGIGGLGVLKYWEVYFF